MNVYGQPTTEQHKLKAGGYGVRRAEEERGGAEEGRGGAGRGGGSGRGG